MKIIKVEISNYRLLQNFCISLQDNLSLIIGRNNSGKTSFLHVLQKFLSATNDTFKFEDFSLFKQKDIVDLLEKKAKVDEKDYVEHKIGLSIYIERLEDDDLSNISDLILDLDPSNNILLLNFEYLLDYNSYLKLKDAYDEHHITDAMQFLKKHHKPYFKVVRKVVDVNDEDVFIEVDDVKVKKIINMQTIAATRDVLNEDGGSSKSNKTLSKLSYKYFKPFENSQASHVIELQKELIKADKTLSKSYEGIFKKVTDDVKKFSYNGSQIFVKSNFQEVNLLRENTSVVYDESGFELPEDYNGLGYMNLFAIIFELHVIFDRFKRVHENLTTSDINLLFIEEPEAHTHPQMQYVFIQKIKEFLAENMIDLNLQTIITTHSAHITSQGDFEDIKYFLNKDGNVEVKNLSELELNYGSSSEDKANFRFLKKYLTLEKSELFFSDKIIFVEGDTERVLMSALLRKMDILNMSDPDYVPLLSQKLSIVEVGTNSKIFKKLLTFLEIKTLIITDIDSVKDNGKGKKVKCSVSEGTDTSNSSIKYYLAGKSFDQLKVISDQDRVLKFEDVDIYIAFQSEENSYHARSFEDAFIAVNANFVSDNKDNFHSLINKSEISSSMSDYYDIADKCIDKKTDFAIDILMNSGRNFENWNIPNYINQGLLWLAKN